MNFIAWLIFLAAAILEVGGDATVRRGLRGSNLALIIAGFVALGCYGLVVNSVKWEFSKLIGVYVAFFAVVSVVGWPADFQGSDSFIDVVGAGLDRGRRGGHPIRPPVRRRIGAHTFAW